MSGLERFSVAKVAIVFSILFTMAYLLASSDYAENMEITTYEKWFQVRPGLVKNLPSFVFTFVCQNLVNLTYESLKPELQTMAKWEIVSTLSAMLSATISMSIGLVLYVTFWTDASSNIFSLYPAPSIPVAFAKFLLSIMMMFTYPMSFLTCRKLCTPPPTKQPGQSKTDWWLLEQDPKQLILPLHVAITFVLWASTTILAILAPSLLDVINLIGSATGTMIAFVLPALFSYQMHGYTHLAATLLFVGGSIGISGTYFSLMKLIGVGE
jgi:amino acid permease